MHRNILFLMALYAITPDQVVVSSDQPVESTVVVDRGQGVHSIQENHSFDPSLFPVSVPDESLSGSYSALVHIQNTLKPILLNALVSFPQEDSAKIHLLQRLNRLLRNDNFICLMDGGGVLMDHGGEMESIFFTLMALPFFAVHTADENVLCWGVLSYLELLSAFNNWRNWSGLCDKVESYYYDETLLHALERMLARCADLDVSLRNRLTGLSLLFFSPGPIRGVRSIVDVLQEHRSLLAASSLEALNAFNLMDEHEQKNILFGSSRLLQAGDGVVEASGARIRVEHSSSVDPMGYALALLERIRNMNFEPKGSLKAWYCHPKVMLGGEAIAMATADVSPANAARLSQLLALNGSQKALWENHRLLMTDLNSLEGPRTHGNRRWRTQEIGLLSDFIEINTSPDSGITMLGHVQPIRAVVALTQDIMNRSVAGEQIRTAAALAGGVIIMPTSAEWFRFRHFGHEFSHAFEESLPAEHLRVVKEAYDRIRGKGYYTAYFEKNMHEALAELMGNWYENSQAVLEVAQTWNDPDFWLLVHTAAYASLDASGKPRVRVWTISLCEQAGNYSYHIESFWRPVVLDHKRMIAHIGEQALSPVERLANEAASTCTLAQNFPNPFNPTTRIHYDLGHPGPVKIVIYNALGLEIKTLVDEERPAGPCSVLWDGTDDTGHRLPAGVFFGRLQTGGYAQTIKMSLIR